jgi:polar amino acid transport system substrate-binding protein
LKPAGTLGRVEMKIGAYPIEQNTLAYILPSPPSVGDERTILGNKYKPSKYYLEDGKPKGILVDIMRYIDQETEHTLKIELYPWKRAHHWVKIGGGGFIGLSMTRERLEIFDYSAVIYFNELVLVVI